jgi:hypothetical protein
VSIKLNPLTGKFDLVGSSGQTVIIDDANGVIMLETAIIEGELSILDDGLAIIKNSLSNAFQRIVEQVTITGEGEVLVNSLSQLELKNG